MKYQTAIISEKGLRDEMEDAYYFEHSSEFIFCGIYDGHGGFTAAKHAREHLHLEFYQQIKISKEPGQAFVHAYETVSASVQDRFCGATAVTFYIVSNVLYYAHAGDARIIIISGSGVESLTNDHRVFNPNEKARIKATGAKIKDEYVMKGAAGLMPTRSLGDEYFRTVGIISTPETGKRLLSYRDQWLVAGTDGLFDFVSNEEIARTLSSEKSLKENADGIKSLVLDKKEGDDNVTFVIVKFEAFN